MFEMCLSRDSESEIILYVPFMCCEYNAESRFIKLSANYRATLSWHGCVDNNEALYSHPRALDLSVYARILRFFCLEK